MRWLNRQISTRQMVFKGALALLAVVAIVAGLNYLSGNAGARSTTHATSHIQQTPTPRPTPTLTPTPDLAKTLALTVNGLRIVNPQGEPITLLGASRFSLEFRCSGDGHFALADFQAMRAWGMNTVRIPLSSAYWRNLGQACPDYHATVASAVANAEAAGLYVILDLQRDAPLSLPQDATSGGAQCPLPDANGDVRFWKELASTYQNDPRVLFDLFGEPNNIGWYQWWNGGSVTSNCYAYDRAYTYTAIGMPALAAAVRAVAPRNIIILSGTGWGYDLSDITSQHAAPVSNVLYATHPWNHASIEQPGDWQRAFGATARRLPVIATEFGGYDCHTSYTSSVISYFQQLNMSYLAWAWTPGDCATPGLLADWNGTPTSPYGAFIKAQMMQADKANPAAFQ